MEEVKVVGLKDGALEIALSGDIDLGNAEAFYQAVASAYKQTPADILFDCEKLAFIDSTTLGTFVKILKTLKSDGRKMKLTGLQAKIKKLFVICSLDTIMEIA
ncbi:MAG: STAS domain-containing protein [Clostridia bacterium]|nr:STAS domain-containing protein [Clostridia bacterium]